MGLIFLFPLAFVSNALVPTGGMPGWLQTIADWNPVSAVTAACRHLFGNPNPSGTHRRLAYAAPGVGRPRMVGPHHRRVRPAGRLALPPPHHRLMSERDVDDR